MEDNDEVICNESYQEINDRSVKFKTEQIDLNEDEATTEYLNLNLEDDAVPETEKYYPPMPKLRRGRPRKKLLDSKTQSQPITSKPNYSTAVKLGPKYRPIRPKPFISNVTSKNKLFGIPSAMNMSTLSSPNRFIVTTSLPSKDKIRDVTVLENSNEKTDNYIKPVNGNAGNITTVTKEINGGKSMIGNINSTTHKKESRNAKILSKSKGSIELFFESMAQTVSNLPMQVQAEIKMEICKVVTMAEIKYCGLQSKHKIG